MTNRKQALQELLAEIEADADSGDVYACCDDAFPGPNRQQVVNAYNGSLDAAMALHNAVLPGWAVNVVYGQANTCVSIGSGERDFDIFQGHVKNPAQAWLIAILQALIAGEDE